MSQALPVQKQRINSIDILRGIIMIIMALDHVRDYFSSAPFDPLDLSQTTVWLFLTRWITHFCAPIFIFLSGTSAFLSLSKKKTKKEASLFLLTRGLWLLLLELTVIGFGWQFDIHFHMILAQVIWAIGWSMIVLAALIWLKPVYIAAFGLLLICGHNLLDPIKASSFEHGKLLWMILHEQNFYQLNSYESIFVLYPLIPWIGVMAVGYAFGTFFKLEPAKRRPLFIKIGLGCLLAFVVLRMINSYGDPFPWQPQSTWWKDILAFIKCNKYPPSLAYLLMTLGVAIACLGWFEYAGNRLVGIFIVYGRVPFFYYILHIYLVHGLEVLIGLIKHKPANVSGIDSLGLNGFSLPVVYLIWIAIVASLYLPCRWYMRYKQNHHKWWLSYV